MLVMLRAVAVSVFLAGAGALLGAVAWTFYQDPGLVRWVLAALAFMLNTVLVTGVVVVGVRAGRTAAPAERPAVDAASYPAPAPALGAPGLAAYMSQASYPPLTAAQLRQMGTVSPGLDLGPGIGYPGQG